MNRSLPARAHQPRGLALSGLFALAVWTIPAAAQSGSECQDLWERRNAIYASAGYCFKTSRAIARFGNAGCEYDREADVPLTAAEKREIQTITRRERSLGCRL